LNENGEGAAAGFADGVVDGLGNENAVLGASPLLPFADGEGAAGVANEKVGLGASFDLDPDAPNVEFDPPNTLVFVPEPNAEVDAVGVVFENVPFDDGPPPNPPKGDLAGASLGCVEGAEFCPPE